MPMADLMRRIQAKRLLLLAIVLPITVRTIPEVLAGPYPLGFDTIWFYAPFIKMVETDGFGPAMVWANSRGSAPLLLFLLGMVAFVSQAEPFLITKSIAPPLFAALVVSTYYFVRRGLEWDERRSLLIILVTTLYFVSLRFSWDMYKNTLGYAFLIVALAHLKPDSGLRDRVVFLSLATLSLLTSELTAVLLAGIGVILFLHCLLRERRWDFSLLGISLVATFAALIYTQILFPPLAVTPLAPPPPRISIPYSYLEANQVVYNFSGIGDVYASVLLLSGIVLGPLLLAVLGFFRERRLLAWAGFLGLGAFSLLIVPFAAFPLWHRWLLMLTIPLLVWTVSGLFRIRSKAKAAFLGLLVLLSVSFLVLPPSSALPYYTHPWTLSYVPSSMLQNTVPLDDTTDVINAVLWLNAREDPAAALLAHSSFVGWAYLYSNLPEIYEFVVPGQVEGGNFSSYEHVFVLYWVVGQGWFKDSLMPGGTVEVHRSGHIAVYELALA